MTELDLRKLIINRVGADVVPVGKSKLHDTYNHLTDLGIPSDQVIAALDSFVTEIIALKAKG